MATIEQLYLTLNERKRPEDVAHMILEWYGAGLGAQERGLLEKAAQGALARNVYGYTSMLQSFAEAKGAGKQIRKAIEIFQLHIAGGSDYNRAVEIESFIALASGLIHKEVGNNDFRTGRLNKAARRENGLDLSKRNYNKKWRLLKRIEGKLERFVRETKKIEFQKIAKHGLAHTITLADFSADADTACFIAYYNARCNLRSVFTNGRQERPFDQISDMLLDRCRGVEQQRVFPFGRKKEVVRESTAHWWAIAHVYASPEVLARLSDEQKGLLLGKWTTILQEIAAYLDELWRNNTFNRQTMIVRRGNDSTTWNNTAGAWNKARDNWMNLIYSMGMEYVLDEICFGKVLRLMAADVAAWHRSDGSGLDPNTEVWNKIPLPWEVFQGTADCNRQQIVSFCQAAGVDPEKSGWVAPRVHGVAEFRPTPELVHGVAVSNPFLAIVLKRHRYFSGKWTKPIFPEDN